MLNFNSILLFSDHPKKLAEFYLNVFGVKSDWSDGDYTGFKAGDCYITIGSHDKVKGLNKSPERLMINFETKDVKGEFERLVQLGAKVVAKPYHPDEAHGMMIATLSDPDGNYFQLMSPWE